MAYRITGLDPEPFLPLWALGEEELVDATIRAMLADERIACIHAHNAAQGCFAARIERYGESGR